MSEEFESTFITLTDEEGNEIELEYLDTVEYNGAVYMSFFPTIPEGEEESAVDDEDYGLIILKVISDNGEEEELVTIEDEAELNAVYDLFMETLFEEEDEEGTTE
ncbi:MAG TPA: DUF1292 domain-containing protein [Candidatus Onthomonas avicola]|nr:DUF1292 domain-containing protein [Candidatus Onthomonas avicola]